MSSFRYKAAVGFIHETHEAHDWTPWLPTQQYLLTLTAHSRRDQQLDFSDYYPISHQREKKIQTSVDLLSHIHSAVGSSFLWSRTFHHLRRLALLTLYRRLRMFPSVRSSGYPLRALTHKLLSSGLRLALLARRPGQWRAAEVM